MKMGTVEDFTNFINAVIDEEFDKLESSGAPAKGSPSKIWVGASAIRLTVSSLEPTIIGLLINYVTMCEELFGPVLTCIYIRREQIRGNAENC